LLFLSSCPHGCHYWLVQHCRFGQATSHKPGDGLVRGKHKVTVVDIFLAPLPPEVVPPEYANPATTPLEVDTADAPFHIKIRKPGK